MDGLTLFLKIFNASISASILALVIVLFRLIFKKAPRSIVVLLWALVAIRLICPVSIESSLSLIPNTETIPSQIIQADPTKTFDSTTFDIVSNPIYSGYIDSEVSVNSVDSFQIHVMYAFYAWVIGMGIMLLYTVISYLMIYFKTRISVPLGDNVFICDKVDTPFIFGVIRPKIYLPSTLSKEDMKCVIAHEKIHLKRKDHIWKPLGFLLLTVYWFNPVLWLSYLLLCRDIELACDEKVIKNMGSEIKKSYSQALINCSAPRRMISACPLAFGEVNVKKRIKAVLNYKKPTFWVLIVAVAVSGIVGVCFMTNPKTDTQSNAVSADIDEAVSNAIFEINSEKSWRGECPAEGHVIFGTEEKGDEVRVYMLEEFASFGFENGWFIVQSSHLVPAVFTFEKTEEGYSFVDAEYAEDGSNHGKSIKRMFPLQYESRALSTTDEDRESLWKQCEAYAKKYIDELGREAKIGTYGDIEHILLTDVGVSVEVSNKLSGTELDFNSGQIGFREVVEGGVRYVYRTSYLADRNIILCTKELYGSNEIVEKYEIDSLTGNVILTGKGYYFDAKVIKVQDDMVLVEPFENTSERACSDKIWVSTKVSSNIAVPDLYDGVYIRIVYDGMIQEVYPAIVPNVSEIYLFADVNYIGKEAAASDNKEPTTRAYYIEDTTKE